MLEPPRVILLSNDEHETKSLRGILDEHAVLTCAGSVFDALAHLSRDIYTACFCAWSFQTGYWHEAVEKIRLGHPDLPVIVLSSVGGEPEWSEVLESGAFDLLKLPCQTESVLAVLEQAVESYEARLVRSSRRIRFA